MTTHFPSKLLFALQGECFICGQIEIGGISITKASWEENIFKPYPNPNFKKIFLLLLNREDPICSSLQSHLLFGLNNTASCQVSFHSHGASSHHGSNPDRENQKSWPPLASTFRGGLNNPRMIGSSLDKKNAGICTLPQSGSIPVTLCFVMAVDKLGNKDSAKPMAMLHLACVDDYISV